MILTRSYWQELIRASTDQQKLAHELLIKHLERGNKLTSDMWFRWHEACDLNEQIEVAYLTWKTDGRGAKA